MSKLKRSEYFVFPRTFGSGETIRGVLKLMNGEDVTGEQLESLMEVYNELNNNEIPKMGREYDVPMLAERAP